MSSTSAGGRSMKRQPMPCGHYERDLALRWFRAGYAAGQAAGIREQSAEQLAELARAVRDFDAERRAERQAVIDGLLAEVIGVLADAMLSTDEARRTAA